MTAHTAKESMRELRCTFGGRIISKGLWSARSPDLTPPCDFYFWGIMKNSVYATNSHMMEELKTFEH